MAFHRSRGNTINLTGWEILLGAFIALIVYQGVLRKWVFPSVSTLLYVAKDVALIGALSLFILRRPLRLTTPIRRTVLPVLWGGLAFIVCLQAFNFHVPSLAVGLLGVRSYLLYSTLLLLMPFVLERVRHPKRLLVGFFLLLIVPVFLLGIYQYSQPVGSWINQYAADEARTVGVLSRPRITGTFSYIGGMGAFLSFALFLCTGALLTGLLYKDRFYQVIGGSMMSLALIVAPMNGSRSVVLGLLVPLPFVLYAVLRRKRGIAVGLSLLLLTVAGMYIARESAWVEQGWEVIEYRMQNASDQDTRIQTMLLEPIRKIPVGGLTGYGAGSTHQAAAVLSSEGRIQIKGVGYENEIARVFIELGIFGACFFLCLKSWLAWIGWKAMKRSSRPWTTFISITSFSTLFLFLFVVPTVFNHVASALYWLCAGCAVWVWSRQEVANELSQKSRIHA